MNDNSHFKISEYENIEFNGKHNENEQNIKELEIEYIQAISDSDSITMTASVRN